MVYVTFKFGTCWSRTIWCYLLPLFILALAFAGPFSHAQTAPTTCLANANYESVCSELTPLDNCSPQLTALCCDCQTVWDVDFAYCSFTLALFPTPTPTVTPTYTPSPVPTVLVVESTPIVPPITCVGGVDSNSDGVIDASGEPCGFGGSCIPVTIVEQRGSLVVGADDLRILVEKSLKKLSRSPRLARDRGLKKRLFKSNKRANAKMTLFKAQATATLAQLPNIILVCPSSIPCNKVDNTAAIISYQNAVSAMQVLGVRTLNRATRLVEPDIKKARKKTKPLGIKIRNNGMKLIDAAALLPKVESKCG